MFQTNQGKKEIDIDNESSNKINDQTFTLITHKNTHGIKISSLFYFIEELVDEMHVILKNRTVKKITIEGKQPKERAAFLLKLHTDPQINLFFEKGFLCTERHLTVDKFYTTDITDEVKSRFSMAHYTERYIHPESQEKIIVHAYFDSQGQLINNIQIKSQIAQLPEKTLHVDNQTENAIKNNCIEGSILLKELLNEKARRYFEKKREAAELELTLDTLCFKLNQKDEKNDYIITCRAFIESIEKINLYNDLEIDRRDQFVKRMLNMLLSSPSMTQIPENLEKTEDTTEETTGEPTAPPTKSHNTSESQESKSSNKRTKSQKKRKPKNNNVLTKEKTLLLEKLLHLENEFDSLKLSDIGDVRTVIKAHQLSRELYVILANLVLINGFKTANKMDKALKRVTNKINSLPSLLKILQDFFINGEVENFKTLFNFSRDKLNNGFCFELLLLLTANNVEELLTDRQIAICNFLFDNSDIYRSFVVTAGHMALDYNGVHITFLLKAVALNNFNLFSMLLRHGCNVQTTGMFHQGKVYSLLKCIILISNRPEFVRTALEYGAVVDERESIQSIMEPIFSKTNKLFLIPARDKISKRLLQNSNNNDLTEEDQKSQTGKVKWDIAYACMRRRYEFIPALAPHSDLLGITVALAEIVNCRNDVSHRLIPCSRSSGVFFSPNNRRRDLITQLLLDSKQDLEQISYIIFSNKEKATEFKEIPILCGTIREKFKQCSPKKVWEILQSLQEMAKTEKDTMLKSIYYTASLFILSQKEKMLVTDKKNLMVLYYTLAHMLRNEADLHLQNRSLMFYNQVLNIAYTSKRSEELINTQKRIVDLSRQKIYGTKYEYTETPLSQKSIQGSNSNATLADQKIARENEKKTAFVPFYSHKKMMRSHSFNTRERVEINLETQKAVNAEIARSRSNSF